MSEKYLVPFFGDFDRVSLSLHESCHVRCLWFDDWHDWALLNPHRKNELTRG